MTTAHSKVGASSSERWFNCPASVRLGENLPRRTTIYAATGTVAHWVGEQCLVSDKEPSEFLGTEKHQDGFDVIVDQEMAVAVTAYVKLIRLKAQEIKANKIYVEERFNLAKLDPALSDAYGTSDCCLYDGKTKTLYVYDYKHGQGVMVEAEGNTQFKYYALGALIKNDWPISTIVCTVVQPRCGTGDGVRSATYSATELLNWAADLVDAVKRTENPNAAYVPGDWCRWCPAAAICPALTKKANERAKLAFKNETGNIDLAALGKALIDVPMIEAWCKQVREFAYIQASSGAQIPGWKLVDKRATRKWRDEKAALDQLRKITLLKEHELLEEPSLKSPAAIEKVLGKDSKIIIDDLCAKESSGTTLVEESDKRPAVAAGAKAAFEAQDA